MAVLRIKVPDERAPEVVEQLRKLAVAQHRTAEGDTKKLWRSVHEQIMRGECGWPKANTTDMITEMPVKELTEKLIWLLDGLARDGWWQQDQDWADNLLRHIQKRLNEQG